MAKHKALAIRSVATRLSSSRRFLTAWASSTCLDLFFSVTNMQISSAERSSRLLAQGPLPCCKANSKFSVLDP